MTEAAQYGRAPRIEFLITCRKPIENALEPTMGCNGTRFRARPSAPP